jgi:hypothetical protein
MRLNEVDETYGKKIIEALKCRPESKTYRAAITAYSRFKEAATNARNGVLNVMMTCINNAGLIEATRLGRGGEPERLEPGLNDWEKQHERRAASE